MNTRRAPYVTPLSQAHRPALLALLERRAANREERESARRRVGEWHRQSLYPNRFRCYLYLAADGRTCLGCVTVAVAAPGAPPRAETAALDPRHAADAKAALAPYAAAAAREMAAAAGQAAPLPS